KHGIGLYIDKSELLRERAIEEDTKFGKQFILLDSDANDFLKFHEKALQFSTSKREIIASKLFDYGYKIICNQPHQFLKDYNNMYLGSNCTDTGSNIIKSNIFPTTLVAGLAELYKADELAGKKIVILANLEPRKLKGITSEGMLLAAEEGEVVSVLVPDKDIEPGAKIR
ncbi:unnamed protein product, partial [marine sediment metagenome]